MAFPRLRAVIRALIPFLACSAAAEETVDYLGEVQPLFATYCYPCHGQWDISREANMRLDKAEFAFADLGDGRHPIVPGKPGESQVFLRMNASTAEDRMPPYSMGVQIPRDKIELVRRWIEEGADWEDVEATGEPQPPGLPRVELPNEPFVVNTHAIPDVRVVPIANGLSHPWSLAFLPNGDMLVTERRGTLRLVRDGKLLPDPVEGVPTDIKARGFSGLMEVAVHPEFEQNRLIYLTYTRALPDGRGGVALVRGRFEDGRLKNVEDVFFVEPWDTGDAVEDPLADLGTYTASSRLLFAPDGTLFMTVGGAFGPENEDGNARLWGTAELAQNGNSHIGKLLRLNDDGSVPADNPFVGKAGYRPEIYSMGHRNQQGLAIRPASGAVYATEHGPQGGDELNLIDPGANYGWPLVSYGRHYDGPRVSRYFWSEGMAEPAVLWTPSVAPSGLVFYSGGAFPQWQGNLFAGAMTVGRIPGTGHLERIVMNDNGEEIARESMLTEQRQRIRDVRQGPDGLLYLLTEENNGALLRLEPVMN
jgi:glucose/arabinose dehydrogenase/mono/diheme cytochrome c family protein